MDTKITLYAVTHKELETAIPERTLIGVGKNRKLNGVFVYDNTKNNIAEKNPNYCELTAMYWIWKNDNSNVIGIEHYRRQFLGENGILKKKEVEKILDEYNLIAPRRKNLATSIYHAYSQKHYESDLIKVRKIIARLYPDFVADFDYLKKTNKVYLCNMVITRKEIYDNYCKWLFDILFTLEKEVDLSDRDPYQQRMYGFMSERLFNIYLHHYSQMKIKELLISEPEEFKQTNFTQKFSLNREIKYVIRKIINSQHMYR